MVPYFYIFPAETYAYNYVNQLRAGYTDRCTNRLVDATADKR